MQNIGDFWYNRSLRAQAEVLSEEEDNDRLLTMAGWLVFGLVLACPIMPLILILAWRIGSVAVRRITGHHFYNSGESDVSVKEAHLDSKCPSAAIVEVVAPGNANVRCVATVLVTLPPSVHM